MDAKEYATYNVDEIGCKHPEEFIRVADDNTGAYCRKCCKWITVTEVAVSAEIAALRAENARLREALENLMRRLDEHFGGVDKSYDWKEQEAARSALRGEQ